MAADGSPSQAAVLGSPISHSLSPTLHRAAYRALGLSDWRYSALEMTAAGLPAFVAGLDLSWRGLSLTMPLKEAALAIADRVTPIAHTTRAANTLVRGSDGTWTADNTDVDGLVAALRAVEHGGTARVLGAGATARSAIVALRTIGVEHVEVAARRVEAAEEIARLAQELELHAATRPLADWAFAAPRLIVSTLPVDAGPALAAEAEALTGVILFDVVYAPWPTPLAVAVEIAGGRALSGLDMLVHQAARQVELFTGRHVDAHVLRAAVAPS